MAGFLLLLLLSEASQSFFELDLPRIAILTAGVGIVAVTGSAMIGTLRGVGWIRQVPEMLEGLEVQEEAGRIWREAWSKVRGIADRRAAAPADSGGTTSGEPPEPEPPEIVPPPPLPLSEPIQWFDPDVDPVEILNDPAD